MINSTLLSLAIRPSYLAIDTQRPIPVGATKTDVVPQIFLDRAMLTVRHIETGLGTKRPLEFV